MSLEEQLEGLSKLPIGYNYGQGIPVTKTVCEIAFKLFNEINKGNDFHVETIPQDDGTVSLSINIKDDIFLVILVTESEELFDITVEKGIGLKYDIIVEEENVTYEKLLPIPERLKYIMFLK